MDLQTLQFFCTTASLGSLTKAAQKLNYAQPNLSTRMRALEEELGVTLFQRGPGGSRLTPKGEVLFSYAQRILKLADETASAVQDEGIARGTLQLGSMESAAFSLLPKLLKAYHIRYPQVRTIVRTLPSQQEIQAVLDGQLDAAIVGGEVHDPDLECVPLTHEKLVVLSSQDEPLEELLRKPMVVFQQGCSYRQRLESICAKLGIVSEGVMEMNSLGAILASVIAGLGVSLFPASMLDTIQESRFLTVTELPHELGEIAVCLVYRKKGYVSAALRELAACFRQECRNI